MSTSKRKTKDKTKSDTLPQVSTVPETPAKVEKVSLSQRGKKTFLRRKKTYISLVVLLVVIVFYASRDNTTVPEFTTADVVEQELIQSVSETGSVKSDLSLVYGWEVSGRVAKLNVEVGQVVEEGQILGELENGTQLARLNQAGSAVQSARASLDLQLAGPSNEDIQSSLASVDQAKATLDQAEVDLERIRLLASSEVSDADIALRKAEAAQNNTGKTSDQAVTAAYEDAVNSVSAAVVASLGAVTSFANVQNSYQSLVGNTQLGQNIALKQAKAVSLLLGIVDGGRWQSEALLSQRGGLIADLDSVQSQRPYDEPKVDALLDKTISTLSAIKDSLEQLLSGMNADPSVSATDKTTITTERSTMNTNLTAIIDAQQTITSAKLSGNSSGDDNQLAYEKAKLAYDTTVIRTGQEVSAAEALVRIRKAAYDQAKASHDSLVAPPREVDLGTYRAELGRQGATYSQYLKEYEKTQLKALSSGRLAKLDVEVGENVTAYEKVVNIISDGLIIEVDISESDIAKVEINDPVQITLDAFGDEVVFSGRVAHIEPAETEISGVVYYKTDIVFETTEGYEVRPGMTANIQIMTEMKDMSLLIPSRAVLERGKSKIVRVLMDEKTGAYSERIVETGIRADDGLIEILSGVEAGEKVITYIEEN